jgi:hypothetical protein
MTTYNVSDAAISQKCIINNADGLERVFPPLLSSRSATVRVHPPSFRVVVGRGGEARPCRSVRTHEAPPEEVLPRLACAVPCNIRRRHNTFLFANRIVDCRGQILICLSSVVHIVRCGQMSKRGNIFFSALTSDTNHIFPTVHHLVLRHSLLSQLRLVE